MSDEFVNLQNARAGVYEKVIADIQGKKVCPFCQDQILNFHTAPLEERGSWLVTDNIYPYKPAKHHRMFIHKVHIERLEEVTPQAWIELGEIVNAERERLGITGGTFFFRFGETKYTGASVNHLHAQLLQSNPDDPEYDPKRGVLTRVG